MMAYICEPGISPQAIETALRALSLRDEAIPFFVAAPDGAGSRIIAASQTMLTLFQAADLAALTARLFAGAGRRRQAHRRAGADARPRRRAATGAAELRLKAR